MSQLNPHEDQPQTPQATDPTVRLLLWGVVTGLVAILGIGYYSYSSRAVLNDRIAGVERVAADQVTAQLQTIRSEQASVASDVAAVAGRVGANAEALDTTRGVTDTLTREHAKTAKALADTAVAVKTVREQSDARLTEVSTAVAGVSSDVKAVAIDLAATRAAVTDNSRKVDAVAVTATSLSAQAARNATALSELRRRGERDVAEFDIRKGSSPETWSVAGIRVELRKADERRSKYDAILHVDDKQFEKKDRTMNEPVPFLVGHDRLRYELVVTAVEHDRIRGYVSMPKDRSLASEGLTALR